MAPLTMHTVHTSYPHRHTWSTLALNFCYMRVSCLTTYVSRGPTVQSANRDLCFSSPGWTLRWCLLSLKNCPDGLYCRLRWPAWFRRPTKICGSSFLSPLTEEHLSLHHAVPSLAFRVKVRKETTGKKTMLSPSGGLRERPYSTFLGVISFIGGHRIPLERTI